MPGGQVEAALVFSFIPPYSLFGRCWNLGLTEKDSAGILKRLELHAVGRSRKLTYMWSRPSVNFVLVFYGRNPHIGFGTSEYSSC